VSRRRLVLIAVGGALVVAAAGFGLHDVQARHRAHARAAAVREYSTKVGPPARTLYASWNTYQASIGGPRGSDEGAVRRAHDEAISLRDVLGGLHAPPAARLFHQEMSDVVANILTVIENRLRIAIASGQPKAVSGALQGTLAQLRRDAGQAFYFVKQTFPDAMAQLRTLEARK
jgi:hypothetical protein